MLTKQEQNALYQLISVIIGKDQSIKSYKYSFTNKTVTVVEDMIKANLNCNANMKKLLRNLMRGGRLMTRGWLKKSLKGVNSLLKNTTLKGYGCLASTKSKWKSAIIISAL